MTFELEQTDSGDWDRFQLRNIGLAVQRRMAAKYQGKAEKFRSAAVDKLTRALGMLPEPSGLAESTALNDFAVALSLVKDLNACGPISARLPRLSGKATSNESRYLKPYETVACQAIQISIVLKCAA